MKNIVLIGILFLLTACSSLVTKTPYSRVQSPEVKSKKYDRSINVFEMVQATQYKVSDDASARPFIEESFDKIDTSSPVLAMGFDMQIFDRTELGLSLGGTSAVRFKTQLLGETQDTSSSGNKSFALFGEILSSSQYNSGDQDGELGPGGYDWSGRTTGRSSSLGISYGQRINDNLLLYTGASYAWLKTEGEVVHERSDSGDSPYTKYTLQDYSGSSHTFSVGLESGDKWQFGMSLNYGEMKLDEVKTHNLFALANVRYNFDIETARIKEAQAIQLSSEQKNKDSWQSSDYWAVASSYFLGFGTGQAIQGRWQEKGKYFAIADGAAMAAILMSFGDCMNGSGCSGGTLIPVAGLGLLISRVWQIVDVVLDANIDQKPSEPKTESKLLIIPQHDQTLVGFVHSY